MTYIRPASSQINLWPSLGLEIDWDVLFNSSTKGEHCQPPSSTLSNLGACYESSDHGFDGPLATCISPHMASDDTHQIFNNSFETMGVPPRCDFNGGELRGFGVQMVTQDGLADVREDAARAYYYPVMDRPNLIVLANTTATRIIWSEDTPNGHAVASGVQVQHQSGRLSTVLADREVILSAGAIRSPAILEHSGIGSSRILSQHSIDVKVDLPSVGENLQDQTVMAITAASLRNSSAFPAFVAHTSLHDLFGSETQSVYESTRAKLPQYGASIAAQNGGASSAAVQQHLLETQLDLLMSSNTPTSEIAPAIFGDFIGGVFWPLQPFSRGSVHINSMNTTAPPTIDAKFLQIDFDGQVAVATAKFVRKFFLTAPMSELVNISTLQPNFEVVPEDANDDVWLDWLKTNSSVAPNYHHLGTCAMLPRDMGGVVDNDFRVYGTDNVRVVDLSAVPLQVAGHSTALLYGIAEWASQKIKARTHLPD